MKKSFILAAASAALSFSVAQAVAEDLDFTLINDTDTAITGFYVSPASSNDWESNLMTGGILDAGYETDVFIADGLTTCVYDIRAVFSDGEALEDYGLDLCELGSYTFE